MKLMLSNGGPCAYQFPAETGGDGGVYLVMISATGTLLAPWHQVRRVSCRNLLISKLKTWLGWPTG